MTSRVIALSPANTNTMTFWKRLVTYIKVKNGYLTPCHLIPTYHDNWDHALCIHDDHDFPVRLYKEDYEAYKF